MNQQRIQAYINLIEQVCELLAQQYIDAGRKNEAEFILSRVQEWVSSATTQPNPPNPTPSTSEHGHSRDSDGHSRDSDGHSRVRR